MKPRGENSLFRRPNSPLGGGKFCVLMTQAIGVQHPGMAARIDLEHGPKGGKFAEFPVIFPALADLAGLQDA